MWMREMFCVKGAMREYLTNSGAWKDRRAKMKEYPEGEELKRAFVERLSRDGLEGPVCCYLSLANNTMLGEERELCGRDENGRI